MIHVVKNVADNIRQKSEVKEEIRVAINGKKYEQKNNEYSSRYFNWIYADFFTGIFKCYV